MKHALVIAAILLLPMLALSGAQAEDCPSSLAGVVRAGDIYVSSGRAEIWMESNGFDGLQIRATTCGSSNIPADQCLVVNPQNWGLGFVVGCLESGVTTQV